MNSLDGVNAELMAEWDRLYDAKVRAATDYAAMMLWNRLPDEQRGDKSQLAEVHRKRLAEDAAVRWLEVKQQMHELDARIDAIQ